MEDDFTRLVSQANPAASQYRPTYPPTTANTLRANNGLDPFFDDDDDLELGTPNSHHINVNTAIHGRGGGLLSPDAPPDSAFASSNSKAMQSTESGLPLTRNAAPPAGAPTGLPHGWGFDDDDVQIPETFVGSAPFPGPSTQPKSEVRREKRGWKWRWPWQKRKERMGERVIVLNDEHANLSEAYCSNYVSTGKYNVATFLPKFLTGTCIDYCTLIWHPDAPSRTIFEIRQFILSLHGVHPTNSWRLADK